MTSATYIFLSRCKYGVERLTIARTGKKIVKEAGEIIVVHGRSSVKHAKRHNWPLRARDGPRSE